MVIICHRPLFAEVKEIARTAACLGREFEFSLLVAVADRPEAELASGLDKLAAADLIFRRGTPPEAHYTFKHALVQDAAYESLLRSTRQTLHARIASVLENRFSETVDTEPEVLAWHCQIGGLTGQAIDYWQRAGQRASDRSSYQEAISHLTTGLTLLQTLPETLERHQQELPLQTALGAASLMVKGHAASDVEIAYTRARVLCQQLGDSQDVFPVLFGLFNFYVVRSDFPLARQLGEDLLALAEQRDEAPLHVIAHHALGSTYFFMGELLSARRHLEEGIACDTSAQRRSLLSLSGVDHGVGCHAYAARTLWLLGYPDQALARIHDGLALANELDHPFSYAHVLIHASGVRHFRREGREVYDDAEAAVTLSTEQGVSFWLAIGTIQRGWALTARGQGEEGLRQMRHGLTDFRASGAETMVPYFLALLAEGYGNLGQVEEGLTTLKEVLGDMERTGEHWWKAEVYRLKGQLLLRQSSDNAAEAKSCFHQALEVSRHQEAKSLELRAATSLARLWAERGERQNAHDLLAPIYGWFTEGFDTADLKDAQALLDELS